MKTKSRLKVSDDRTTVDRIWSPESLQLRRRSTSEMDTSTSRMAFSRATPALSVPLLPPATGTGGVAVTESKPTIRAPRRVTFPAATSTPSKVMIFRADNGLDTGTSHGNEPSMVSTSPVNLPPWVRGAMAWDNLTRGLSERSNVSELPARVASAANASLEQSGDFLASATAFNKPVFTASRTRPPMRDLRTAVIVTS